MKNLIAGLMAVFVINSVVAGGYKDDNVRWLVYDMKTKDKTLMDIRMETFLKGQATFTGPMNRIGRRKAESGKSMKPNKIGPRKLASFSDFSSLNSPRTVSKK